MNLADEKHHRMRQMTNTSERRTVCYCFLFWWKFVFFFKFLILAISWRHRNISAAMWTVRILAFWNLPSFEYFIAELIDRKVLLLKMQNTTRGWIHIIASLGCQNLSTVGLTKRAKMVPCASHPCETRLDFRQPRGRLNLKWNVNFAWLYFDVSI